jgi:GAF domain-containing protein
VALRHNEERLAADLAAMTRMQQVSTRLVQAGDSSELLQEILDAAIDITGADMGAVDLIEAGVQKAVAQRGFDLPFLDFLEAIHRQQPHGGPMWAWMSRRRERLIVEDVATSPIFAAPIREALLGVGVRALQATRLVDRGGRMFGTFATHYRAPRRPDDIALRLLDVLARSMHEGTRT